jgi:hypothetical protein
MPGHKTPINCATKVFCNTSKFVIMYCGTGLMENLARVVIAYIANNVKTTDYIGM